MVALLKITFYLALVLALEISELFSSSRCNRKIFGTHTYNCIKPLCNYILLRDCHKMAQWKGHPLFLHRNVKNFLTMHLQRSWSASWSTIYITLQAPCLLSYIIQEWWPLHQYQQYLWHCFRNKGRFFLFLSPFLRRLRIQKQLNQILRWVPSTLNLIQVCITLKRKASQNWKG